MSAEKAEEKTAEKAKEKKDKKKQIFLCVGFRGYQEFLTWIYFGSHGQTVYL